MKLSKTQFDTLKRLVPPDVRLVYMRYMGRFNPTPHYFFSDGFTHVRKATVDALVECAFAKRVNREASGDHDVIITEAGRQKAAEER